MKKMFISGRVTKDVVLETRKVAGEDRKVANFNVAINVPTGRRDENGKRVYETEYVKVSLWGRVAEAYAKYLYKGREIEAIGNSRLEVWTDRNNQIHPVEHMTNPEIELKGQNRQAEEPTVTETAVAEPLPEIIDADELPFD